MRTDASQGRLHDLCLVQQQQQPETTGWRLVAEHRESAGALLQRPSWPLPGSVVRSIRSRLGALPRRTTRDRSVVRRGERRWCAGTCVGFLLLWCVRAHSQGCLSLVEWSLRVGFLVTVCLRAGL